MWEMAPTTAPKAITCVTVNLKNAPAVSTKWDCRPNRASRPLYKPLTITDMNTFRYSATSSISWRRVALEVIIFLCVLLFVYAALSKLIAVGKFEEQIEPSPLIGSLAPVIVWAVPIWELLVATCLMVPRWRTLGFYAFWTTMLLFTLYIVYIIFFSPTLPCSCGGILEKLGWADHLIFNIIILGLATLGIFLHRRRQNPQLPEDSQP